MQRTDLIAFEALMHELADCYDRKPYGPGAIKHWFAAFSEFSFDKVRHKLALWRDSKIKPPTIADILTSMRDQASDELERRAQEDKKAFSKAPTPVTPHGIACMEKVREMLAHQRKPGRWWAYELRDRYRAGGRLNFTQAEMAKKACGQDWDSDRPYSGESDYKPLAIERVPGEDDE